MTNVLQMSLLSFGGNSNSLKNRTVEKYKLNNSASSTSNVTRAIARSNKLRNILKLLNLKRPCQLDCWMSKVKGLWSVQDFKAYCKLMLHQSSFFFQFGNKMDRAERSTLYFQLQGKSSLSLLKSASMLESFTLNCELENKETLASAYYEGLPKVSKESTPDLEETLSMKHVALMSMENVKSSTELTAYLLSFIKLFGLLL